MTETKPAFMLARELTAGEEPRAVDVWRDTPTRDGWHLDRDTRPWRAWTLRADYGMAKADLERLLAERDAPPALDAMEAAKELRDLAELYQRESPGVALSSRLRAIAEGLERGAGAEKQPRPPIVTDAELERLRKEFGEMSKGLQDGDEQVDSLDVSVDINRILLGGTYR